MSAPSPPPREKPAQRAAHGHTRRGGECPAPGQKNTARAHLDLRQAVAAAAAAAAHRPLGPSQLSLQLGQPFLRRPTGRGRRGGPCRAELGQAHGPWLLDGSDPRRRSRVLAAQSLQRGREIHVRRACRDRSRGVRGGAHRLAVTHLHRVTLTAVAWLPCMSCAAGDGGAHTAPSHYNKRHRHSLPSGMPRRQGRCHCQPAVGLRLWRCMGT